MATHTKYFIRRVVDNEAQPSPRRYTLEESVKIVASHTGRTKHDVFRIFALMDDDLHRVMPVVKSGITMEIEVAEVDINGLKIGGKYAHPDDRTLGDWNEEWRQEEAA